MFNDIGLFRFSLIAPALNNTHGFSSNSHYFKDLATKSHFFNGKQQKVTYDSLRKWLQLYKKNGIDALCSHQRKDKNCSRKLSNETILRIIELREQFPRITGTSIYNKLVDEGYFSTCDISKSTVLRFIKHNNLKAKQIATVERRMFEMDSINYCWQADTSDGPYIVIDDKKVRTKLIMFIDDKSRMIMGFDFFINDNAINMQKVFKNAILTYGVPKKLFVDNGGPYDNKQLSLICATLGIELIHAKPYSPESKAKIERSFKTIKEGWMNCTNWNDFTCLNDVKQSLSEFIQNNYNNKIHSSTKMTPNERWHQEIDKVQFLDENLIEESFMHRTFNKVRKDRTISFKTQYYEVPFKYVGQTVELRYDPNNLDVLFLYENNKKVCDVEKVDKIANSKSKRKNGIDYSKLVNDERDVYEMEEN